MTMSLTLLTALPMIMMTVWLMSACRWARGGQGHPVRAAGLPVRVRPPLHRGPAQGGGGRGGGRHELLCIETEMTVGDGRDGALGQTLRDHQQWAAGARCRVLHNNHEEEDEWFHVSRTRWWSCCPSPWPR